MICPAIIFVLQVEFFLAMLGGRGFGDGRWWSSDSCSSDRKGGFCIRATGHTTSVADGCLSAKGLHDDPDKVTS